MVVRERAANLTYRETLGRRAKSSYHTVSVPGLWIVSTFFSKRY